ncbi:MAG: PhoU domain-containing protein, partial [Angelakisella sp.]
AVGAYRNGDAVSSHKVEPLEQIIDTMEEQLKTSHIARLRDGNCSVEGAFAFVEAISSLERIADHCSNIAVFLITVKEGHEDFDTHAYLHALHKGSSEEYERYYQQYKEKYLSQ